MQERLDRLSLADARRLKVSVTPTPDKHTPEPADGLSDDPSDASSGGPQGRTPVGASSTGASE
jgi:hypothetical protein